jgi:O-antigen/teichoic acid export membrane protein
MMMGAPSRIAFNVIANYLGQGWAALMAIAFLPVYVAALGLEAYGLIGFFAVLQSILAVFDLGITATLTREAARHGTGARSAQSLHDLVRSFELIGGVSNILLSLIVWGVADWLASNWVNAHLLASESVSLAIALMGGVIAARLQEGIYRGVLLGLDRQVLVNVVNALMASARYAGAVAVLHYGRANIITFFAWQVLVSLVSLIIYAIVARRRLPVADRRPRFSVHDLGSVWRFSAGMALLAGLSIVMANLDKLVLSGVLQLDEFGRYALAAVAASVLYLFVVPITQGFYPSMVGMHAGGDRTGLIRLHHTSSQLVAVSAGSMAIILVLFPMQLIYVWSGDAALAHETAPVLAILATAALANCLGHIGHNLHLVSGNPAGVAVTGIGAVLLTLCTLPTAVVNHGLIGATYVWLCIVGMQAGVILLLAHRGDVNGEGLRWLMRDIAAPLAGAFMTAWLFSCWTPQPDGGRLILAGFLVLAACASLAAATLLAPDVRNRLKFMLAGSPASAC